MKTVKRIILCCLLGGMLLSSTGCGLCQLCCWRPCSMRGDCGTGMSCDGCDDGCGSCGPIGRPCRGPVCAGPRARLCGDCGSPCDGDCGAPCRRPIGRCGSCGPCGRCSSCGTCSDPCADPCGNGSCGRTWHRGPLSCVFALFMGGYWCGPSCGQRYWGDFYSDPPDCMDPCDCGGNFTGGRCHTCGNGYGQTTGYNRTMTGGVVSNGSISEGNIISQSDRVVGQFSNDVTQPHRATKP